MSVFEQREIKRFNLIERFKIRGLWSRLEDNKDAIIESLGSSLSDYLTRFNCKLSDSIISVSESGFYSESFRGLIIKMNDMKFKIDYHPTSGSVYIGTNLYF